MFWASVRAKEVDDVTKDKQVMDGEVVVHNIFYSETDDEEDWNKLDEEDSTLREVDSFTADRLATEQEGKITAH